MDLYCSTLNTLNQWMHYNETFRRVMQQDNGAGRQHKHVEEHGLREVGVLGCWVHSALHSPAARRLAAYK